MRKYWSLYKIGIQNTLYYRGPIIFWLLGNITSLIMMISIWTGATAGQIIGGYTKNQLISYYLLSLVIVWVVGWHPADWVAQKIRNGEIISDGLLKPISFYVKALLTDLGWHTVAVPFAQLASILFIFLYRDIFVFTSIENIILMLVSCILAALLSFSFGISLGFLAFWITETNMVTNVYWAALGIFGGNIVPISFFPQTFTFIVKILPFRYMFSFPLELYFGQMSSDQIIFGFCLQFFWVITFFLIQKWLWSSGAKIYNAWGQ